MLNHEGKCCDTRNDVSVDHQQLSSTTLINNSHQQLSLSTFIINLLRKQHLLINFYCAISIPLLDLFDNIFSDLLQHCICRTNYINFSFIPHINTIARTINSTELSCCCCCCCCCWFDSSNIYWYFTINCNKQLKYFHKNCYYFMIALMIIDIHIF